MNAINESKDVAINDFAINDVAINIAINIQ